MSFYRDTTQRRCAQIYFRRFPFVKRFCFFMSYRLRRTICRNEIKRIALLRPGSPNVNGENGNSVRNAVNLPKSFRTASRSINGRYIKRGILITISTHGNHHIVREKRKAIRAFRFHFCLHLRVLIALVDRFVCHARCRSIVHLVEDSLIITNGCPSNSRCR